MPIYKLQDTETEKVIELFMNMSEFDIYSGRNENGLKIYTGSSFPDAEGQVVFILGTTIKTGTIPGRATRKFGDRQRSPNFGRNKWI